MRRGWTLEVCTWSGSRMESTEHSDPSADEVGAAVAALNGRDRNDLYLRSPEGAWMGFGGGPDLVFACYSESDDGPHFELAGEQSPVAHALVVGGQQVVIDAAKVVGVETAQELAERFLSTGTAPEQVRWEER